ncbi:MAG: hypothetical protein ACK6AD_09570 [Cyanobacteriota bacterium]
MSCQILSPAAHGQGQPIQLDCRLGPGAWQACQMVIIDPGREWFLVVGKRRYRFQHDGTGQMRMAVDGRWREVTPRWEEGGHLCWDGICARGELPLD